MLSAGLSATSLAAVYITFLQGAWTTRRTVVFLLVGFMVGESVFYGLLEGLIIPQLGKLAAWQRSFTLMAGLLCGTFLFTFTPWGIPDLLLFPHHLQILTDGERDPNTQGDTVELTGFQSEEGYLSYSAFDKQGDWRRVGDSLISTGRQPAWLSWEGRVKDTVLTFRSSPNGGKVMVIWDGVQRTYDLYSAATGEVVVHDIHRQPIASRIIVVLLSILPLSFFCVLLVAWMMWVWGMEGEYPEQEGNPEGRIGVPEPRPMKKKRYGWNFLPDWQWILILFSLLGSILFWIATSKIGLWIASDSSNYIAAAKHFLAGEGYVALNNDTYNWWPPLYPVVLMLVDLLPSDLLETVRILHLVLFGLTVYLSGVVLHQLLPSSRGALAAGMALLCAAIPLMVDYSNLLSESIFILLLILFFIALFCYYEQPRPVYAILATLFAAAVTLTRYIGVILILVGGMIFLFFQAGRLKKRVLQAVTFCLVASMPIGLWLGRNYLMTSTLTGVRTAATMSLQENLSQAWITFYSWYLPPDFAPLFLLIALGIAGWAFFTRSAREREPMIDRNSKYQIVSLVTFTVIYVVSLILYLSVLQNAPIGTRLLSPVFIPFTLLMVVIYQRFRPAKLHARVNLLVSLAMLGLLLVQPVRNFFNMTSKSISTSDRLLSIYSLRDSELIQYLKEHPLPSGSRLYSNCPRCLFIFTGIHPVTQFDALPSHSRLNADQGDFYVIWFDDVAPENAQPGENYPMPDILKATGKQVGIRPVAQLKDGEIIRVTP